MEDLLLSLSSGNGQMLETSHTYDRLQQDRYHHTENAVSQNS